MPTVCKAFKETGLRNRPSVEWSPDLFVSFPRLSVQVEMFSSIPLSLQMWTQSYTIGNAPGSARSQGGQKQSRMSWILKIEQDFDGKE